MVPDGESNASVTKIDRPPPKLLKTSFRFYSTYVYAQPDSAWLAAGALGEQWSTLDGDGARQFFRLQRHPSRCP